MLLEGLIIRRSPEGYVLGPKRCSELSVKDSVMANSSRFNSHLSQLAYLCTSKMPQLVLTIRRLCGIWIPRNSIAMG
jgi:hypothetical protein